MDISKIDKNFRISVITEKDVSWNSITENEHFKLCGVYYDENLKEYRRLSDDVASKVNGGVKGLAMCTSGGRIRFTTNSPYIALFAVIPTIYPMDNMCLLGESGFGVYVDGIYKCGFFVNAGNFINAHKENSKNFSMEGIYRFREDGIHSVEIYMPLYSGAKEVYIGTKENSIVEPLNYDNDNLVAVYGSSITQGGCASHPGNDYIAMLSRKLNFDYINMGFSGSAHGEDVMAEYYSSLPATLFLVDYDHNANGQKELLNTHYRLYQKIREKNPLAPIIFVTKPDIDYNYKEDSARREIIFNSYKKAKENGDNNVDFVDGEKLFGDDMRDACTVDTCHPNDLGFYRMAKCIEPYLVKYLNK